MRLEPWNLLVMGSTQSIAKVNSEDLNSYVWLCRAFSECPEIAHIRLDQLVGLPGI
jgi:hypothetical protein